MGSGIGMLLCAGELFDQRTWPEYPGMLALLETSLTTG